MKVKVKIMAFHLKGSSFDTCQNFHMYILFFLLLVVSHLRLSQRIDDPGEG